MERTSRYRTLTPMIEAVWITIRSDHADEGRTRSVALTRKGRVVTSAANVHWGVIQARIVKSFGKRR